MMKGFVVNTLSNKDGTATLHVLIAYIQKYGGLTEGLNVQIPNATKNSQ